MFCSKCGVANVDDAVFCRSCATAIVPALTSGNRLIAAGLSLVVPGLGQAFLGRPGALRWFVKTLLGYLLIIPGLIFHAMCIIDAISIPQPTRTIDLPS